MIFNNYEKYLKLRKEYPVFIFRNYNINRTSDLLSIKYNFELSGKCSFYPEIHIPLKNLKLQSQVDDKMISLLAFNIGMVELVSYWKAACSPTVIIEANTLSVEQVEWWKKLYFHGLGEFFYLNSINAAIDNFMEIKAQASDVWKLFRVEQSDKYIVPVGGGKDSIVTLELLKSENYEIKPLVINPGAACLNTVTTAGFENKDIIEIKRSIHPQLLKLNDESFLNGHTPFSSLLAFISLLGAYLTGTTNIALSNEASANEATVRGTKINHQYSKSYEFESDFRNYTGNFITPDINYFSFLRPLHEIQIAALFSGYPQYFKIFRSCNSGSKQGIWCGKCPKCLFIYIILSPFLDSDKLNAIFGTDLFADEELDKIFSQLTGESKVKPFECVGTVEEVNIALNASIKTYYKKELPYLLKKYIQTTNYRHYSSVSPVKILQTLDNKHFLSEKEINIIKINLDERIDRQNW